MINSIIQYILPGLSIVLSVSIVLFSAVKGRSSKTLKTFILCHILSIIWILGQILENVLSIEAHLWNATLLKYTAIIHTSATWLVFCLLYTNRIKNLRKTLAKIYIGPIFFNLVMLTNPYHGLFFLEYLAGKKTYGIIFWVHVIFSYSYILGCLIILAMALFKYDKKHKMQYILLQSSIFLPAVLNCLYITGVIQCSSDFTPTGFVFSSLIFFIGVFNYRFLDLLPFTLGTILNNIPQAIMVVDNNNNIIYANNAFNGLLPQLSPSRETITRFTESLGHRVHIDKDNSKILERFKTVATESFKGEFKFTWPNQEKPMCYSLGIIPIKKKNSITGRIIVFHDITNYKQQIDENIQKNDALSLIAQKLFEVNCCACTKPTDVEKG